MAKGKKFDLSIVLKAIDKASATFRRVNRSTTRLQRPIRRLTARFKRMARAARLPLMAKGFRRIRTQLGGIARGMGILGIGLGGVVAGFTSMIDKAAKLGDIADRIGLSVDALAGFRHAAKTAGVETDELDAGIQEMAKRMGEARAGTGELLPFLKQISPALAKQAMAAKGTEEQFLLFSEAISKLSRESDQLALADKVFGSDGEKMLLLLKQGRGSVSDLRDEYLQLAGPQEESARKAQKMRDNMLKVKASMDGVKAAILTALAPAFVRMSERMQQWFDANREAIAAWVADFGEKLPGRIDVLVQVFRDLFGVLETVVGAVGGFKNALMIVAAFMAAKFAVSVGMVIVSLASMATTVGTLAAAFWVKLLPALKAVAIAMLSNPIAIVAAAIALAAFMIMENWEEFEQFFKLLWDAVGGHFKTWLRWAKTVFFDFNPLVLLIKNWGPIAGFFQGLWDGIVGIFESAWEVIEGIVDQVVGAAETVIDAAKGIVDVVGGIFSGIDLGVDELRGQANADQIVGEINALFADLAAQAGGGGAGSTANAKITVDFENLPRGARVEQEADDDADVDLTLGYASGAL